MTFWTVTLADSSTTVVEANTIQAAVRKATAVSVADDSEIVSVLKQEPNGDQQQNSILHSVVSKLVNNRPGIEVSESGVYQEPKAWTDMTESEKLADIENTPTGTGWV